MLSFYRSPKRLWINGLCLFMLLLTAAAGLQCASKIAGSGNEAGNNALAAAANALIDLPSSLAKTQAGIPKIAKTAATPVEIAREMYDGVRDHVGFADALVNGPFGVKPLILFWKDSIDWQHVKTVGEITYTEPGIKLVASVDTSKELSYQLIIYATAATSQTKALQIDFNGDLTYPKGTVYYCLDALNPTEFDDSIKILVDFSKTDTARTLEIQVTTARPRKLDDPQTLSYSMIERNGIVHISGASYHPDIDSILVDTVGHCYVFKAKADTFHNLATVEIGLPPATYANNDTTVFTTYGLANLYSNVVLRQIKSDATSDTVKMLVAASYQSNLSIEGVFLGILAGTVTLPPPSAINSMTAADLEEFLTLNANVSNPQPRSDFASLLFVMNLDRPVYFDKDGYVADGLPTPAQFGALSLTDFGLAVKVPSTIKTLSINY